MKKGQFIELIKRRLPVSIHPMVIDKNIEPFYEQSFVAALKALDYIEDDHLVLEANKTVVHYENETARVTLSGLPINLPLPGSGVREVTTNGVVTASFVPQTRSMRAAMTDMECVELFPEVDYTTKRNVVTFYRMPKEVITVNVYYIPAFSSILEGEELTIPAGMQGDILEGVINFLMGTPPDKLSNDKTQNPA